MLMGLKVFKRLKYFNSIFLKIILTKGGHDVAKLVGNLEKKL